MVLIFSRLYIQTMNELQMTNIKEYTSDITHIVLQHLKNPLSFLHFFAKLLFNSIFRQACIVAGCSLNIITKCRSNLIHYVHSVWMNANIFNSNHDRGQIHLNYAEGGGRANMPWQLFWGFYHQNQNNN